MNPAKSHRPWWKKFLIFAAFALVTIITIAVLLLSWISFQGRQEWAKTKADLLARGEKLSLVELLPPAIPDDQNFFGDPMWSELLDIIETPSRDRTIPYRKTRLPKGKRRIDAINPEASPELLARAKAIIPSSAGSMPPSPVGVVPVAYRAYLQLRKTTDPAARGQLVQLIFDALAPGKPARQHIESLLTRPGAFYRTDYSLGISVPLEHIGYFVDLGNIYRVDAAARLVIGEYDAAAHDVAVLIAIANTLTSDPLLISLLVRTSLLNSATGIIDQGIVAHAWNDRELAAFEQKLRPIDLLGHTAFALRGERGMANQMIQTLSANDPKAPESIDFMLGLQAQSTGVSRVLDVPKPVLLAVYRFTAGMDQASYNRLIQQCLDVLENPNGMRPESLPASADRGIVFNTTHWLTGLATPFLVSPIQKLTCTQETITMTYVACALERFRLRHGSYPDSLEQLVPEFLPAIPTSVIAGQKFHYRPDGSGKFRLWSAGWNQTDDGGIGAPHRGGYDKADWVWNESPGSKR